MKNLFFVGLLMLSLNAQATIGSFGGIGIYPDTVTQTVGVVEGLERWSPETRNLVRVFRSLSKVRGLRVQAYWTQGVVEISMEQTKRRLPQLFSVLVSKKDCEFLDENQDLLNSDKVMLSGHCHKRQFHGTVLVKE